MNDKDKLLIKRMNSNVTKREIPIKLISTKNQVTKKPNENKIDQTLVDKMNATLNNKKQEIKTTKNGTKVIQNGDKLFSENGKNITGLKNVKESVYDTTSTSAFETPLNFVSNTTTTTSLPKENLDNCTNHYYLEFVDLDFPTPNDIISFKITNDVVRLYINPNTYGFCNVFELFPLNEDIKCPLILHQCNGNGKPFSKICLTKMFRVEKRCIKSDENNDVKIRLKLRFVDNETR